MSIGQNKRFIVPLAVFAVVAVFLGIGLTLDPRKVPSPLIDRPAPAFTLPTLHDSGQTVSAADFAGQVWLLNVWASWCVACRVEHEVLKDLARQQIAPIVGLNYKDQPANAKTWLRELGDPYHTSVVDADGKIGIDWGVYGVPETFVIDRSGVISYKHIGPLSSQDLHETLAPIIKHLRETST